MTEIHTSPHPASDGAGAERASVVVGIGASAGGLRALERFFSAAPTDRGWAFVIVQHLDPNHDSELAELLQNHTRMPVTQVNATTRVAPDHVYIIPPAKSLTVKNGALHLGERPERRGGFSLVDRLFRSLAEDGGERAIGVVLSGTGTDGTLGLAAIKEAGGLTLAQDPADAEYDGMPSSAVNANLVDVVARAEELPRRLMDVLDGADAVRLPADSGRLPSDDAEAVAQILALLHRKTGNDFRAYKNSTVMRRLGRRMQVTGQREIGRYLERARERPEELEALQKDLLISVTHFFRDPDAFAALEQQVVPQLLAGKRSDDEVRVWVPGCATGEEAYSVAMLLHEALSAHPSPPSLQVFATDIDETALEFARRGSYPQAIATDVSAERLERFFQPTENGFLVRDELRDTVLIAPHNLLRDPPFSRLDLITCRNVLIYLDNDAQQRVFTVFHYALNPDGFLFLGSAEVADGSSELFLAVDKSHHIYRRRQVERELPLLQPRLPQGRLPAQARRVDNSAQAISFAELNRSMLLRHMRPSAILLGAANEILHVQGGAGHFLRVREGEITNDLLKLARPGLDLALRGALHRLRQHGQPTRRKAVRVAPDALGGGAPGEGDDRDERVALSVYALSEPDSARGFVQVVLEPLPDEVEPEPGDGSAPADDGETVRQLEAELTHTRHELQITIEELETTNEELHASNEELQSTNEELQSANEELETSREELQSTNEELVTVNQELKNKIAELNETNSDLANLLSSTDIATLFLDRELCLKRYTPAATRVFNLIPADVGRPLAHLSHELDVDDLARDCARVLESLEQLEREVRHRDGRAFILRLLPYRTRGGDVGGVVATLIDITRRRRSEERLAEREAQLRLALEGAQLGVWRRDLRSGEMRFDARCRQLFGVPERAPAEAMLERIPPEDRERVATAIARAVDPDHPDDHYMVEHRFEIPGGEPRWMTVRGQASFTPAPGGAGRTPQELFGVVLDTTEVKRTEAALRASERRYRGIFENAAVGVGRLALDGRFLDVNHRYCEITGYSREEMLATSYQALTHPDDLDADEAQATALARGEGDIYRMDKRYLRKDGVPVWVRLSVAVTRDAAGTPDHFVAVAEDITPEKRAQAELERLTDQLERRVRERTQALRRARNKLSQARDQERRALARTLHDASLQKVLSLHMELGGLAEELKATPGTGERHRKLKEFMARLLDVAADLRLQIGELRPAGLDEIGLRGALEGYVAKRDEGRSVRLELEADPDALDDTAKRVLFKVAQELLRNAWRHAGADDIAVTLRYRDGHAELRVRDDGRGFEVPERLALLAEEDHFGLLGLEEEAEAFGGALEVRSTLGAGTEVRFRVPLRSEP